MLMSQADSTRRICLKPDVQIARSRAHMHAAHAVPGVPEVPELPELPAKSMSTPEDAQRAALRWLIRFSSGSRRL
jgi:hypothetical protein